MVERRTTSQITKNNISSLNLSQLRTLLTPKPTAIGFCLSFENMQTASCNKLAIVLSLKLEVPCLTLKSPSALNLVAKDAACI